MIKRRLATGTSEARMVRIEKDINTRLLKVGEESGAGVSSVIRACLHILLPVFEESPNLVRAGEAGLLKLNGSVVIGDDVFGPARGKAGAQ
jgi:hypothetical protein